MHIKHMHMIIVDQVCFYRWLFTNPVKPWRTKCTWRCTTWSVQAGIMNSINKDVWVKLSTHPHILVKENLSMWVISRSYMGHMKVQVTWLSRAILRIVSVFVTYTEDTVLYRLILMKGITFLQLPTLPHHSSHFPPNYQQYPLRICATHDIIVAMKKVAQNPPVLAS